MGLAKSGPERKTLIVADKGWANLAFYRSSTLSSYLHLVVL